MNLKKGDKVLCVENNSTVRPLVIESVGDKIVFSKQLDKGVKRTFGLKEGSFQLIKPRYISEHEKKGYKNPDLERHDRVMVIHVEGTDNTNLLGRDGIVISIKENERGDREIILYMEDTQQTGSLELEYRPYSTNKLIEKSLVLKLDEPKAKEEDYYDDLLNLGGISHPRLTENTKEKISPDLEVGDRIMTWDISPDDIPPGGHPDGEYYEPPSTFIATVIEVLDIYDPRHENGIKYLVKIEDTDEVVGLYGGEWAGGSIHPIRNMYQKDTRDKWLKLPKLGITEETDIFGQGLLDPIEPEEFEGEDEEWEDLVDDIVVPEYEPEYDYQGGKTDPTKGFVAPSAEVTDNICKVKGFCKAQGPITFGQLRELVEKATSKRIQADMGRGLFKTLWRIIPFFIPQILLAAVGITATRAINKMVTPALKDTRGYKEWWGKVVLKAMDIAEGDYVPDIALGDDPLSKVFFISDGLLQMIRDKYKLKFARYVADYAASKPDNEPVPDWFVENLLRDYLNQKFLLNPPLEPKEGTDFKALKEHDETDVEVSDNESYQKEFTKNEVRVLNYLSNQFGYEELAQISSTDETELPSELQRKWDDTIKLFGERTDYVERVDYWVKSTRWAKWAVDNWNEACDGPDDTPCNFKDVTNPVMETPKMYRVAADESMWEKIFRSGEAYVGGFDEEDVEDRADSAWYNYDVDMETYDYGDTDQEELEIRDPEYLHDIMEHKESKINPDLDKGDTIRVIEIDGEHANMPDVWGIYKVHDVRQDNATQEFYYQLSGETSEVIHDRLMNGKYLYYGDTWIPADVPMANKVDRKTISEHKESKKLNPELMVGDEILVVSTEGIHDFGAPELYKPYVVVGIKHGTTMMKGGKELEDYPYYQVEPIGMTDEERTGAMLAGGGRMKPMYIFPRQDQWILIPGFLRGEHLTEEKESGGVWDYIFGDSIAVGLSMRAGEKHPGKTGMEMRSKLGWSREGATPQEILKNIKEFIIDNDLTNKKVLLSSGYSNSQDLNSIRNEIDVLRGADANVYLLGVSHTFPKEGDHNDILEEIANEKGVTFLGGFDAPRDDVHPAYGTLYNSISSINEHIPQPGSSSAEGIKDDSLPYETQYLTLDEILTKIKSIPYYNEVLDDLKDDKEDWAVTQTVKRYAKYWMENPESLTSEGFPPIQVIGDGLKDGAHRISTLNALANHIDPTNPYWKEVKLEVRFYPIEVVKDIGPTWVKGKLVYDTKDGLKSKSLNEHKEDKNMKGFTPKLIGYLKFMFGTKNITNVDVFQRESRKFMGTNDAFSSTVYLMLLHNKNKHNFSSIVDLLNNLPVEDYEIPIVYEYEVVYFGPETSFNDEEECDNEGFGEYTGEECDCIHAEKTVEDEEGYVETEECDDPGFGDCECEEYARKQYELYMNENCRKVILSLEKLENTEGNYTYGYETMNELEGDLGYHGSDFVEEYNDCEDDYDDAQVWDYFNDREDEIIGLDTSVWDPTTWVNYFTDLNKRIYGVKPIEEQYDMMSQRDKKMTELTSQIYNVLDNSFDLFEHPEGEIEYEGKNMALYSHDIKDFVPFDYIYNPIEQMLEHGIQQEDIEIFVEIITNWVTKNLSTPEEQLNEEVNILSDNTNYSKKDYEDFVDFAHKELKIEKDCPIDVEGEKSEEYTTGNYHIHDKKIKILDNGRKLADILRTIAHELVHHKQNELGMLGGPIPEIGGPIEDQANAYAGRLVKKYGKQTPTLYTESQINVISEEKVVGFNNPSNNFVVIAGGPGAGKSFITRNLINLDNVKEFNVDQVRVMTAKKLWGDEWEENISTEEGYDEILRRTFTTSDPRNLTVKHLKQFLEQERNQPVNVVYDAGGGQEQVMKDVHNLAKENGFNTTLVYVRTPLEIAQERNIDRPRSLPPEMVAQYHQQVKDNMRNMIPIFDNVWTVDNKEMIDLADRPSDNIEKLK